MNKLKLLIVAILTANTLTVVCQESKNEKIKYNPELQKLEYFLAVNRENQEERIDLNNDKYFLLDFSIPFNHSCIDDLPLVVEQLKENNDKLDAVMLWSTEDYDFWMDYTERIYNNELPIPLLLDNLGTTYKALDIEVFPTYMLFNKDGILIKIWKGKSPKNIDKYLE